MSGGRDCFDGVADLYARVRPGYPDEVLDWVLTQAGLDAGGSVLEIAPGTGQLSCSLASRGLRLHGVELGVNLAERAREALAPWPQATIEAADFETWSHATSTAKTLPSAFDLVVCAQAFHWIDPLRALPQAASALRAGGHLALIWTLDRSQSLPVYAATTPLYDRYQVGTGQPPLPGRASRREQALAESPHFGPIETWSHFHEVSFSAAHWLELVQTFSTTLALSETDQVAFLSDLSAVLEDFPLVERHYETLVYLAPALG
ncbi:MAG: class I SAM-dependent methyltransferase [Planctomycetes bacterium]|nr:class I SAM-dependent methyltransferase [Planctomycetota bacterium]